VSVQAASLHQQGDILAGIDSDGQWQDGGQLQLNVTGELDNRGRIISQGTVQIASDRLYNRQDAAIEGRHLTVHSQSIDNSGLLLADTLIATADTLDNRGQVQGQTLALTATQLTQHDGVIYQQGEGQLRIGADTLSTPGGIVVSEGEAIVRSLEIIQGGDWLLGGAATIDTGHLTNSGTLQFLASAALNASVVENRGQLLFMGQEAPNLQLGTRLSNSGLLQFSSMDINLTLPELINTGG
ncbi:hypothetical protein QE250_16640, partial [Chromatiaceae bacterium AAb-1]|nr:hypothetical protein [Chromatiaceae bacterium AAb-1]